MLKLPPMMSDVTTMPAPIFQGLKTVSNCFRMDLSEDEHNKSVEGGCTLSASTTRIMPEHTLEEKKLNQYANRLKYHNSSKKNTNRESPNARDQFSNSKKRKTLIPNAKSIISKTVFQSGLYTAGHQN